jgi:Flp pilus assembly protein TadG
MIRKNRHEQGATIVEAAIIFPVLIVTIVGLLELGLAFKDFLTVSFAAREGARIGSLVGNDVDADCQIIQGVISDLGASLVVDGTIANIEIFRADPVTGNQGLTNDWTYTGSDPTDCLDWTPFPNNWPSTNRVVVVGPTSTLDILGVTINASHDYITNVPPFGGTIDVSETALQRLEPEAFE